MYAQYDMCSTKLWSPESQYQVTIVCAWQLASTPADAVPEHSLDNKALITSKSDGHVVIDVKIVAAGHALGIWDCVWHVHMRRSIY